VISLHNYEAESQSLSYGFDVTRKGKPPAGYQATRRLIPWLVVRLRQSGSVQIGERPNLLYCPSSRLMTPSWIAIPCGARRQPLAVQDP
jgi:hypothetical protein